MSSKSKTLLEEIENDKLLDSHTITFKSDMQTFWAILDIIGALQEASEAKESTEMLLTDKDFKERSRFFFDGGGTAFIQLVD